MGNSKAKKLQKNIVREVSEDLEEALEGQYIQIGNKYSKLVQILLKHIAETKKWKEGEINVEIVGITPCIHSQYPGIFH